MRRFILGFVVFTFGFGTARAQSDLSLDIASHGVLRYGVNLANAGAARRESDGSVSGIAIDFGTFLAKRLGVTFKPVTYNSTGAFTRSFGKNEWDVTVVGASPGAKRLFNFTPDVLLVDYVYLARPGRAFASVSDVDRPGVKVGAAPNGSGSQFLAANLKYAKLILGAGDSQTTTAMLREGTVDAYGSNVNNLLAVAARLPGSSFVPGAFFTVHFAAALPNTRSPAALEKLKALVAEAKASGLLQKDIDRAGLKGMRPAP